MLAYIQKSVNDNLQTVSAIAASQPLQETLIRVASQCVSSLKGGKKLIFMGNGGSAADSQHLAGEMVSRFAFDRPGLPAIAITTDTSILTAIGNDYGFEQLFSRQIEALGKPGDVLFGISTSGKSPNILSALRKAKSMGIVTIGMTGNQKASIVEIVDECIEIPSAMTPRIQEGHILCGHILCGLIEESIFGKGQ